MRTWGRITNQNGSKSWVQVSTDENGFDDMVWVTTLLQVLQLNLNESPFYANYGIPAQPSIISQVMPDFYVARTQAQFAKYFASLTITKANRPTPTYNVNVVTHQGVKVNTSVQVPR